MVAMEPTLISRPSKTGGCRSLCRKKLDSDG